MDWRTEWGLRLALAIAFAILLAGRSMARRSLSASGGAAAFVVGTLTFMAGPRFVVVLLVFFVTCSYLTKRGKARKRKVEEDYEVSSCRNWEQVFCNGSAGTAVCAILLYIEWSGVPLTPRAADALSGAFLGHYACCIADTWASELGILSTVPPFHILTLRQVPAGTNGGVSWLGLAASVGGAALLGAAHWLTCALVPAPAPHHPLPWRALVPGGLAGPGPWMASMASIPITAALGLLGSVVDSILGALVQYSGSIPNTERVVNGPRPGAQHICGRDILSNNTVNFLSSVLTAAVGGLLGYALS